MAGQPTPVSLNKAGYKTLISQGGVTLGGFGCLAITEFRPGHMSDGEDMPTPAGIVSKCFGLLDPCATCWLDFGVLGIWGPPLGRTIRVNFLQ